MTKRKDRKSNTKSSKISSRQKETKTSKKINSKGTTKFAPSSTPPQEGCRICKKDDDHANVLLCEKCDAEYHIYCLKPPLESIPDGEWFCDKCLSETKAHEKLEDEERSGCRVCLKDEDHPNTLICEKCEGEYHIYCLDPPLKSIPDDDWYCENCRSPKQARREAASTKSGCRICRKDNNNNKLLLCKGCDDEYHLYCVDPPLKSIPKENWYCEKCRSGLEESHAIMDETSKGSGCRICHRDDDFAKMLLCEGCDDEYHIYCLNPPLKSVPKDDWYCGKCIGRKRAAKHEEVDYSTNAAPKVSKGDDGNQFVQRENDLFSVEQEDEDVPVREITTVYPQVEAHVHDHGPKNIDEGTMHDVKTYLQNRMWRDRLNDDEVVQFGLRAERVATQQYEYQRKLLGDDESDNSFFEDILQEELEHALGKEIITNIMNYYQKEEQKTLDKKSINWIKRASGLHRSRVDSIPDEDRTYRPRKKQKTYRRYTRKAARDNHTKKAERGLNILSSVIDHMESVPFELEIPIGKGLSIDQEEEEFRDSRKRKIEIALEAHNLRFAQGIETSITDNEKESTLLNMRRRSRHPSSVESRRKNSNKKSIRLLEWERRSNQPNAFELNLGPTEKAYKALKNAKGALGKGLSLRLPEWPRIKSKLLQDEARNAASHFKASRSRHSHENCAVLGAKLIHFLQAEGRMWAIHEFFYSDLDRAWYSRDEFAEEAAKLGIRPDVQLSRKEWRVVRNKITTKPKRFSRRFILSQMSERNKYRGTVRKLQREGIISTVPFEYEVLAPITAGSIVTAYSSTYGYIQRGVTLSYDDKSAHYLVQFENRLFGQEFCPDSVVASHGRPIVLQPAPHRYLSFAPLTLNGRSGVISTTTEFSAHNGGRWTVHDRAEEILNRTKPRPLLLDGDYQNQIVEREMLLCLLTKVDIATERRQDLLKALDELNRAMIFENRTVNKDKADATRISAHYTEHFQWLLANLEITNHFLRRTMSYLRIMYGKVYLPLCATEYSTNHCADEIIGHILKSDEGAQQCLNIDPWVVSVSAGAETTGGILVDYIQKTTDLTEDEERSAFTSERFIALAKLLLTAEYCQSAACKGLVGQKSLAAATDTAVQSFISLKFPTPPEGSFYEGVASSRDLATNDLLDAMQLLKTEIATSRLQKSTQTLNI